MPLFEIRDHSLAALTATTFSAEGIQERRHLQRMLRDQVRVLADDLLVIAEEFGNWEDSQRRIDLLAVDRQANLVVIELKRTEDGGHVELQAIRYAAMVSTMTFDQAVDAFARYLQAIDSTDDARDRLLGFLGWTDSDDDLFAQDVRIILVSADFSKEVTTSVLWLNDHGLDIRCVRLKPYKLGDRVLIDAEQIIPLKEAEDFQVHLREKNDRERDALRKKAAEPWTGFWYVNVDDGGDRSWEDCRRYGFVGAGGGARYSDALKNLSAGDRVYAYQKARGYVGYGVVDGPARMAKDFVVSSLGKPLFDQTLVQPNVKKHADDPEKAEWVVPIRWVATVAVADAKRFEGAFANQNVVCKLRQPATLAFLAKEFGEGSDTPKAKTER